MGTNIAVCADFGIGKDDGELPDFGVGTDEAALTVSQRMYEICHKVGADSGMLLNFIFTKASTIFSSGIE